MRRIVPEICGVEYGSREKVVQNLMFFAPKFGRGSHFFLGGGGGICKSTPLPTYWPGLVEIPWLVFHLCLRNKKSAVKYNGLAFGGHKKTMRPNENPLLMQQRL